MHKLREIMWNVFPPSKCITISLSPCHCQAVAVSLLRAIRDKLGHHRLRNKLETVPRVS